MFRRKQKPSDLYFNKFWMAVGCHASRFVCKGSVGSILKADNQYFCSKLLRPLQIRNLKNDLKVFFFAFDF